ncbi:MAG: heavy metal-responsive transcriptional regulator [Thermoanaerobaculia bacterium]
MTTAKESRSLRAGELAALAGLSKDALRFYERRGLLPVPRRGPNGYRRYPPDALGRVLLIRVALSIGFSVSELASIVRVRDSGGAPCRQVRSLAAEKLEHLRREIEALSSLRADLEAVLADWDRRLAVTGNGRRAGLLEALVARRGSRISEVRPPRRRVSSLP